MKSLPLAARILRCAQDDRVVVTHTSRRRRGGTIINVITAVIFFGLIGLGIWWVIKTMGEAGQQYTNAMIETSNRATTLTCQSNMRSIHQSLHVYAIGNESFPGSQEELVNYVGYPRLFHCPDPNGSAYVYIPGQSGDMPPTSVLLYETKPVHDGRCNALLLDGRIALLTSEELKQAVAATLARRR